MTREIFIKILNARNVPPEEKDNYLKKYDKIENEQERLDFCNNVNYELYTTMKYEEPVVEFISNFKI